MYVVSKHWLPSSEIRTRVCRMAPTDPPVQCLVPPPAPSDKPASSPAPTAAGEGVVANPPPATAARVEGFLAVGDTAATPPLVSSPVRVPTLIIWSSPQCPACRSSAPTFRALENNTSGWTVVRLEATADILKRFSGHLVSLPTYDFLYPEPGMPPETNALGIPGVRLHTVRVNSPQVLRSIVPSLRLATEQ